jgi:hypothetical protein
MKVPPKFLLAATLSAAASSFAASIPKTILPDNVVRCEPGTGCVDQTLYGRTYKVMATPRFTVMVSVSHEGIYTRADVNVTNNTGVPLSVSPEDFRVEVVTPKPKVLLYISPAHLTLPPAQPAAPAPAATAAASQKPLQAPSQPAITIMQASTTSGATTDTQTPESNTSEAADRLRADKLQAGIHEAAARIKAQQPLEATSIPPNEATSGRVYFECDKKADLVNIVIPIAGLVFEFPYSMKGKLPEK